ncbi:CLCA3_4 [Lepeophtheirus salmonis]|uniref:CLCA3_4 n=1 Tax=Lepeophtheirus salmonis TaxID=72036 RepID=A0A7R8H8W7_LEPSM|nr:CLCA3_4 [Lepeophtheirus salmonis]CAF2945490.1 CLCA3_4 [Lepeophtheirus salmonis]
MIDVYIIKASILKGIGLESDQIASGILFDTFDKRPYFKRVTVIVPNGWSDSVCEATIQPPSYPSNYGVPDIFLSPDGDAIYGNHPRTIRSMGCGLSGDFIEFPYSLLSDDRIAARSLVSEWAKYRYGVFEEHGFPGDPYYPVYYERNETLIPSGNTDDRALHGEWKDGCNPQNDKNCYFKYSDTSEIKCSLGFVPFLSNVSGFCHKNNNFDSVKSTKQFTLCQGKSSSQIIHDHKDFQSLSRLFHHPHPESTLVSFVREPIKKYLFFVEASSTVANSGLWKWISKATQNLIRYDLPEGSEISIVTYSNETFVMAKSAILKNNKIRGQLADRMPSKQQVKASSEKSFVSVAFDFIISNKLGLDSSGTKIVIIKRDSDEDGLNREWEQKLINYTRRNQVQFSTILFRDSHHGTIQPSPFYDSLSELSGGKTFVYDLNVQTSSYFNIMSSLKDIIILDSDSKSRNVPRIIHSSVSKGLEPLESSFYVDTFVGKETIFGILVNDAENHKVKSVTFWDESGNSYGPYQSLSSEYNVINMKTINFLQIAKKPPFDDVSYLGKPWKYKVEWFSENSNKYDENVVVVTSKERNPESQRGLVVDVWTSAESSNDKVTDKHPLSIYVRLTHGFRPVANAKVTCQISIMQDVGSLKIVESEVFELFDTGNGDPDIIMNDGIYSRYVTEYHGTGRYQFSIYVENSSKNAFVIKNSGKKFPSPSSTTPLCCGSLVPVEDDLKEPIEPFHRVISGPVVYLLETPSEKEDKWLLIDYLFVLMNDKFQVKNTIHELQRSDSYGTKVSTSFDFPIRGKVSYVGLIPTDESGNQGNVSNIVTLLVPLNPATVSPTPPWASHKWG